MTKQEFLAELEASKPPSKARTSKPKKPKAPPRKLPKDDSPASRIVFALSELNLDRSEAQLRLAQVLIERGYPGASIPQTADETIEAWIAKLIQKVPSAEVMDAARSLHKR